MRIQHEVELTLPIDVRYDDGEPYGVIDAPPEVRAWLEERLGVRGMLAIDTEVRTAVEVERQNDAAAAAEYAESSRQHRAMAMCDYGIAGLRDRR